MKVTAITRYKQGDIFNLLEKVGWTQSDLARASGLSPTTIGAICNLKRRPTEGQANCIQRAFGSLGEYFDVLECWPETFQGTGKRVVVAETKDVDVGLLIQNQDQLLLGDKSELNLEDMKEVMAEVLGTLSDRERTILQMRFDGSTLEEVRQKVKCSKVRIRQIEAKALRKLRHPSRISKLEPFAGSTISYVNEALSHVQ
jgi:DNA-binding XRE family transcriptional regulator